MWKLNWAKKCFIFILFWLKYLQIYEGLLALKPERFLNILKLIETMCIISRPSTAECERGFSTMMHLESPQRNRLDQTTLQSLLRVSIFGPSVEAYKPQRDVDLWLRAAGTRHVKEHGINPSLSLPRKNPELDPEDKYTQYITFLWYVYTINNIFNLILVY